MSISGLSGPLVVLVIALCKFGHRKLDISKTISARSFKLGQLIEDDESITW